MKAAVRNKLYDEQNGRCNGCFGAFYKYGFKLDYIVPLKKGGEDVLENCQLLCGWCMKIKGDNDMDYLLKKRRDIKEGVKKMGAPKSEARQKSGVKNKLYDEQNGRCNGCHDEFMKHGLKLDYIVPLKKGGEDDFENCQLLCGWCMKMKGDKDMDYLHRELERISKEVKWECAPEKFLRENIVVKTALLPKGTYWIGDPYYALHDEKHMQVWEGKSMMNGWALFAVRTYADGTYRIKDEKKFEVDTAMIALLPLAITDETKQGIVKKFDTDFVCRLETRDDGYNVEFVRLIAGDVWVCHA